MKRVLLMTVAGILVASSAMAAMENARFAMHAKASFLPTKAIPGRCDNPGTTTEEPNYSPNYENAGAGLPCSQYNTQWGVGTYSEVYVVVGKAGTEGIAGVSFGVHYLGVTPDPTFLYWNKCADGLDFPNGPPGQAEFPADNGGIRLTWTLPNSCQTKVVGADGVHAVVGAFEIYGYDGMVAKLTSNNNLQSGPELAITACTGVTTDLLVVWQSTPEIVDLVLGAVGFGSGAGYNPCLVVPAKETTWGKIKRQYN